MTRLLIYIFLGLGVCFITACEDVVDLQAEDAPSLITVDAWLNNRSEPQSIKLTSSQQFFANSFNPGITGADVVVVDDLGHSFDFIDQGDGTYMWTPNIGAGIGALGTSYNLQISVNGKNLSATTTLKASPEIDSIAVEFKENETFFDDGYRAEFFARDLVGSGDTYWIKTFRDGVYLNEPFEINLAYDAGFDSGSELDGLIFIPPIRELVNPVDTSWVEGQLMRVEIHSISNDAFTWMEIARDQILNGFNGIFAEPLANASGNIINNTDDDEILGVFNVADISSKEIIIQ